MNFLIFQFKNSFFLVKKHKFLSFLMIMFIILSLLILGKLIGVSEQTESTSQHYDETYGNKTYFFTNEAFPDPVYYEYLDDEKGTVYNKLVAFEEKLKDSTDFTYIELISQQLEIVEPAIPDKFLLNYEEGLANESVFEYNNEVLYATKTLQVSPSFFDEYDINVSAGQAFSENDYLFRESAPIPILLGAEYKDTFQIGDMIESYYITEKLQFSVKGFISEDSFFFSRMHSNMVSCGRYIIMPALTFGSASELSKLVLLQKLTGIISSSCGYEKTVASFEALMKEAKVDNLELNIVWPNSAHDSIFDQYSAMTNEVADQFLVMVLIVMFFGIVAAAVALCSMLRENRLNFGLEMLCGATKIDIFVVALIFLVSVLLGDVLCCVILLVGEATMRTLLCIQASVIGMLFISGIISAAYVVQMPMHDIIGGNE